MERNRAWRRKKNYSKANRKKEISDAFCAGYPWYKHKGQYIKGKIHCSCMMCSTKTNNRGRYGPAKDYSRADKRKIESLDYKCKEWEYYKK